MRISRAAFLLLFGCVRGIPANLHRVEPAPVTVTASHTAQVTRVSVGAVDEDHGREIDRLWVELELREDGVEPWRLVAKDLALARGSPSGAHNHVEASLGLEIAGAPAVALVEPTRADPMWVAEESSMRSTMGMGLAEGAGTLAGMKACRCRWS